MNKGPVFLAFVIVSILGRSAAAQTGRVVPMGAGMTKTISGPAAVPQMGMPSALIPGPNPTLIAGALGGLPVAPGLVQSALIEGPAESEVPSIVPMEEYQRQLKVLWAQERALGDEIDFRLQNQFYRDEQALVQKIAVARAKRPGATSADVAQAKIAELQLRFNASAVALFRMIQDSSTLGTDALETKVVESKAAFDELSAYTAQLPVAITQDLRSRALEP